MAKNANLRKAAKAKSDEFYTQLTDIEKEMMHYWEHFKGKTIFCNCDDPKESAFWKYFDGQFNHLGLKRLITTHYNPDGKSYMIDRTRIGDESPTVIKDLEGDGDFRSEECIELLKQADIVVTNPPFSLFREYVAQLMEYNKKFIIIGNQNALTYKETFPLMKDNRMWLGASIHSGDREFRIPDDYEVRTKSLRIDEDGNRYIRVPGVRWYTNLDISQRHDKIELWKKYTTEEYPKYDNYDAIEVSKTVEIPKDYYGEMGVPITFMDKYCPEQFEIIGLMNSFDIGIPYVNGQAKYARIVIKRKEQPNEN